jgi:primosomal protein N' (replication factor Y) (superfamily II helicase)
MSAVPSNPMPQQTAGEAAIADVLIPVAVDTAYSYRVPTGLVLELGDVVRVPLGAREATGVVWGLRAGRGDNLKPVLSRVDAAPMSERMRQLVDWMAWYTLNPRGSALSVALRAPEPDARPERLRLGVRLVGPPPQRMTPARARAIAAAEGGLLVAKSALCEMASVSSAVIDALVDEGTFLIEPLPQVEVAPRPDPAYPHPPLSALQASAAAELAGMVKERTFAIALLEGVTGSGKTEVYFEAVAEAVAARAAMPDPDAGNRADRAVHGPLSARFGVRRRCGIPACPAASASGCMRLSPRRGAGGGRRALGAVPAVSRSLR